MDRLAATLAGTTAEARFRLETDCSTDFRVNVENLPAGDYTLRVGGTAAGTITVASVNGEFHGQIELSGLDPRGQLVEVVQGATIFLSRTFPN